MKTQPPKKLFAFIATTMMFSVSANAQIVYTDLVPDKSTTCSTSSCSDKLNIDLNNDGNTDFFLSFNRTYLGVCGGGRGGFNSVRYAIKYGVSTPGANSFYGIVSSNPSALNYGNVIDSNINWSSGDDTLKNYNRPSCTTTNVSGNWNVTTDRYLPVKISIAGNNHFGWMRIQTSSLSALVLKDFAYNSIPNQPIFAGQTCPPKVVVANAADALCVGDSLLLTANIGVCGSPSLLWSTGETTTSILVKTSGTYSVTLTDTAGYSTSDSVTVTINHFPPPTVNASGATTFCTGGSVTLSSSFSGSKYLWSNKATTQSISTSTTGKYSVTVTDTNGCTTTSKATSVIVNSLPSADAGYPTTINQGDSYFLGGFPTAIGNSPFTYNWTPTTGLDESDVANPIATPMFSRVYSVVVTDVNGCEDISSVTITVIQPSGIVESAAAIGLLVFPNPANELLNVTGTKIENGEYRFELKNVVGQTMLVDKMKVSNNSMQTQFSISEFSTGIYFLIIENGVSRTVTKVQKMH